MVLRYGRVKQNVSLNWLRFRLFWRRSHGSRNAILDTIFILNRVKKKLDILKVYGNRSSYPKDGQKEGW